MPTFPKIQLITLLGLLLLGAMPVSAHVSSDMPDPIAEVEYQMMLDFEPDDLLTRYKLAMVYYRLHKDVEAEREFQKVLQINTNYFHALEGLGILYLRQNKFEIAVQTLKKAVTHKKRESGTYYYLGKALEGLGKLPEAKEILKNGLALCRNEPEKNRYISIKKFQDSISTL